MKNHWKQAVVGVGLFGLSACANSGSPGPTEPEVVVKDPPVHSCDPAVNPENPTENFTGYYGQRICMGLHHYLNYHQNRPVPSAINLRVNADLGIPYRIPGLNDDLGNIIAYVFHRQARKHFKGHDQVGYDFRHSPKELVYHQCQPGNKKPGDAVYEDVNRPGTHYCLNEQEAKFFINPER